jgi:hypothetical protein
MARLGKGCIFFASEELMTQPDKKREWFELLARCGGILTTDQFIDNAKRESSAFHDDFSWNQQEAARQYYHKRAADLIRRYTTLFNTRSADQRLHKVPMLPGTKAVYKSAKMLAAGGEEEFQRSIAIVWGKLRTLARDLKSFAPYVPEFNEIYRFLGPRVEQPH